ncbi:MAG: acetyl-CoA hydrolase/transferase C-terminal domain-containing protein [Bryobacteraceae bacterium]
MPPKPRRNSAIVSHKRGILAPQRGVADLRGKDPHQRARLIIDNCANPEYRDQLHHYLELTKAGHTPQSLSLAFAIAPSTRSPWGHASNRVGRVPVNKSGKDTARFGIRQLVAGRAPSTGKTVTWMFRLHLTLRNSHGNQITALAVENSGRRFRVHRLPG